MNNLVPKKNAGPLLLSTIIFLATVTYFLYRNNKKRYAKIIISTNASQQPFAWLVALDESYLKAWANALQNGETVFMVNGKRYNSQGGKATA